MKTRISLALIIFVFTSASFSQSIVIQNILNQTKQDSLVYFVKELSGAVQTIINGQPYTIQSRHKNQPGNDKAKQYIMQKLSYYGLQVSEQSFSSTGKNVIGVQPGTEFPNQKYIICAHYDDMPSGTTAPGADDNASGTAAVIEAARIFSQYDFPFTIIYALWDEEEQGLIGSEYYATQAANAGDSILGVINLDMIGYDGNNDGNADVHNSSIANTSEIKDKMLEVNTLYGINLDLDVVPAQPYSDHQSFLDHGYGAILLIEDDNDFHPYYHTVNDLIQYFNQPYFFKMAKLSFATLASFALNLNMKIVHTPVASMDLSVPVNLQAQIVTGLTIGTGISAPRLYYRTSQGGGTFSQFNEVVGNPALSGTYNFTIPAQPLGTIVQYYLAAQDNNSSIVVTLPAGGSGFNPPGNVPPSNLYQFYVAPITYAIADSAMNTTNWTSSGGWALTNLKYVSAPYSFTDSPGSNYNNGITATFTYNFNVNLSNILGASLEFDTQWDIENNWDYGQVQVSTNNGSSWIALAGNYTNAGTGSFQPPGQPLYDGTQTTWVHETIDLSGFTNTQLKLRFLLKTDSYVNADGWYIDNIKLLTYQIIPVELTSFQAVAERNSVLLNWSTATELNNRGFEIQKSGNKTDWQTIGFVEGNGTTTSGSNYSYVDSKPLPGISYYRLKQVDFDGSSKVYDPIEVNMTGNIEFELSQNYPNPFNPSTTIAFVIANTEFVELMVYDVLGNEVARLVNEQKEAGRYEVVFDASKLASGMYVYTLKAGDFVSTKKLLLMK
ncbi:MAG: M28 family peptidase [Ignavibacteriaceae bacterium]|nr:M28 family peptidase [Ignavibacteriaceae bacterium]